MINPGPQERPGVSPPKPRPTRWALEFDVSNSLDDDDDNDKFHKETSVTTPESSPSPKCLSS